MKAKRKSQYQHSQRRASERYGMTVGHNLYDRLCERIQRADCVFLERQSNRVSVFAVEIDGAWVPVVYDKARHAISTFLPREALDPYRAKLHEAQKAS